MQASCSQLHYEFLRAFVHLDSNSFLRGRREAVLQRARPSGSHLSEIDRIELSEGSVSRKRGAARVLIEFLFTVFH